MTREKQYIAVDLGAESGRVMLGAVSADSLELEEVYRFANDPVTEKGHLKWDIANLLSRIEAGLAKAVKKADGKIAGIGVDSWGVDYGLLDHTGELIQNPYHYRDTRTDGLMDKAFELMNKRDIYENTGLQFMRFNTVYQLLFDRLNEPDVLAKADKLLFIADLVSYHLCGKAYAEYTLASTSQLMDMRTGKWSEEIFNKLILPINIMPEIIAPATIVAPLKPDIASRLGCEPIPVIAVGSHDTASAVAAVPAGAGNWAYLSSGTWSLLGVEIANAIINDKTFKQPFTNEGGIENTIRLLKNVMGLWLIQQCRKKWQENGLDLSYADLANMAEKAEPFAAYIDPDHSDFLAPGDMPARINQYLTQTAQSTIDDKGQMVRVILESLAMKYRSVLEALTAVTNKPIDRIHIVGGGVQNELLCQFTANATGRKVITGPVEATAIGNIITQAVATGQINSLAAARKIIRHSFDLKEYHPENQQLWNEQFGKIKSVFEKSNS